MDDDEIDFGEAAFLFTKAIHDGPPTAALYAERAQAFIKTGNFAAAAADATRAADLDPSMPRAYLRKAQACLGLKQYGPARDAAEAGAALAPGDERFAELMKELDQKAAAEAAVGAGMHELEEARRRPRPAHRRASSCDTHLGVLVCQD